MRGVLIISHGGMCVGIIDSLKMFFGDCIEQIDSVSLTHDMGAEDFMKELVLKMSKVDKGDGVVIFCDMLGGTPANQALQLCGETVQVITGVNLPMIMEYLATRENETDYDELIQKGRSAIINGNLAMLEDSEDVDDD